MDDLTSRTLWLSVWDWDGIGRNQFLGEVHLPISSMDLNDPSPSWYTLLEKVRDRIVMSVQDPSSGYKTMISTSCSNVTCICGTNSPI